MLGVVAVLWVGGGVLCGGVGVCVHVQGGDPDLGQETWGGVGRSRYGCGEPGVWGGWGPVG